MTQIFFSRTCCRKINVKSSELVAEKEKGGFRTRTTRASSGGSTYSSGSR